MAGKNTFSHNENYSENKIIWMVPFLSFITHWKNERKRIENNNVLWLLNNGTFCFSGFCAAFSLSCALTDYFPPRAKFRSSVEVITFVLCIIGLLVRAVFLLDCFIIYTYLNTEPNSILCADFAVNIWVFILWPVMIIWTHSVFLYQFFSGVSKIIIHYSFQIINSFIEWPFL